jgi:hypothetical protein
VEHRRAEPPAGAGPEEITRIARGLRDLERELADQGPEAVLIASRSAAALAAVIVATKLGTPVARLEPPEDAASQDANARLIRQLADTALPPDPVAIVEWLRGGYPARA